MSGPLLNAMVVGVKTPFISTWNTANAGTSTSTQIKIPTFSTGSYRCVVYWGDGASNVFTVYNDANWTHTYASSGIYTVSIYGTFNGFIFNNGGDKLKLLKVSQWGTDFRVGTTQGAYFSGCTNLTITAQDKLNLLGTTVLSNAFVSCSSLGSIPGINTWDTSQVTTMANMFQSATAFNGNISAWNISAVTSIRQMLQNSPSFNQDISGWDVRNVTDATLFLSSSTLSKTNYNKLLALWSAQIVKTGVTFHGGNSHYDSTTGGFNGTAGRLTLTATYTWAITDGGTP